MSALLPVGILDYFDIIRVEDSDIGLNIYLEENNSIPQEFKSLIYHSKGFYPEIRVQDFPIRGKKVYLCIKRRRWENQLTGEIISRDWSLVQSGTRMTAEFAAFLKEVFG
ncbi:MAG: transposase family protein [Chitinophagaceae bacterium]|nr:transposase family protein [Chitinophagaceae bacterium]MBX3257120.1 transposase family protein [Chitinophagaceae bacterium]